jgi:hypothetical protein
MELSIRLPGSFDPSHGRNLDLYRSKRCDIRHDPGGRHHRRHRRWPGKSSQAKLSTEAFIATAIVDGRPRVRCS